MTPEQKELFRMAILRVLDANNTRFGLTVPAVSHMMAMFGFPNPKADEVADEIEYLSRRELIQEVLKIVSKENRAWRITTAGSGYLDSRV